MDDKELRDQLRRLPLPESSESAREKARHRALIAFNQGVIEKRDSHRSWLGTLAWGSGLAVAAVLVCFLFSRHGETAEGRRLAKDWETLRQTEALFSGQLNALIERDGDIQVELSDSPARSNDQPILIQFKQEGRSFRVLSYSGRRVCVDINGKRVCFEALMTGGGGVILSGENFLWSPQHPTSLSGYQVEARLLAATL